ncbi:questin oxidase family protein [Photobacterium sp. WH77]|uniref:Questin oxidase family protein n=1 Tax=Photobacterium arenosum TaxID=2774143 RepID=A0ABR9BJK6_9GAMM|nr:MULTISPECIES: questin oxidase family protein [Photobacterium]MBD8512746.1 questin oxidase family protein [Photobacterium arenosum]MBV7261166.1 questin oxidase family protein [Photobacterium sp. WH24]MCG2835400.1 questin oxidase family protein [Photobacterium sp. WH77]MCG2843013.1 questin oxidase family protein [Photobacterium sp. WH80]
MYAPIHAECLALIDNGLQFDPIYGPELSNHLPMALVALARCGASPLQLQHFYQKYTPQLQPIRQGNPTQETAPELGIRDSFAAFYRQFRQHIAAQGVVSVLHEWLPVLLPGLATSAFHGLIRLSYAVETGESDEIAVSLAYWASEYQALGELHFTEQYQAETQLEQACEAFRHYAFQPGIIVDRVNEVVHHAAYQSIAAVPDDLTESDIARLTIRAYLASNDFTLLHGVTGFDALLQLMPFLPDRRLALAYYWQGYVAAFCSTQDRPFPNQPQPSSIEPDWVAWFSTVATLSDDHSIKLTYSCSRLYQTFQFNEYLSAIQMRLAAHEEL